MNNMQHSQPQLSPKIICDHFVVDENEIDDQMFLWKYETTFHIMQVSKTHQPLKELQRGRLKLPSERFYWLLVPRF